MKYLLVFSFLLSVPLFASDYYELLGVKPTATQKEIEKAYRKKAVLLHPDNAGDVGRKQFQIVQDAYDTLKDVEKKARYDANRASSGREGFGQGFNRKESSQGGRTSKQRNQGDQRSGHEKQREGVAPIGDGNSWNARWRVTNGYSSKFHEISPYGWPVGNLGLNRQQWSSRQKDYILQFLNPLRFSSEFLPGQKPAQPVDGMDIRNVMTNGQLSTDFINAAKNLFSGIGSKLQPSEPWYQTKILNMFFGTPEILNDRFMQQQFIQTVEYTPALQELFLEHILSSSIYDTIPVNLLYSIKGKGFLNLAFFSKTFDAPREIQVKAQRFFLEHILKRNPRNLISFISLVSLQADYRFFEDHKKFLEDLLVSPSLKHLICIMGDEYKEGMLDFLKSLKKIDPVKADIFIHSLSLKDSRLTANTSRRRKQLIQKTARARSEGISSAFNLFGCDAGKKGSNYDSRYRGLNSKIEDI